MKNYKVPKLIPSLEFAETFIYNHKLLLLSVLMSEKNKDNLIQTGFCFQEIFLSHDEMKKNLQIENLYEFYDKNKHDFPINLNITNFFSFLKEFDEDLPCYEFSYFDFFDEDRMQFMLNECINNFQQIICLKAQPVIDEMIQNNPYLHLESISFPNVSVKLVTHCQSHEHNIKNLVQRIEKNSLVEHDSLGVPDIPFFEISIHDDSSDISRHLNFYRKQLKDIFFPKLKPKT